MSKNTITVRVTCHSGKTWITSINGTLETAADYFTGVTFTDENPETGEETRHTVTCVEQI